MSVLLTQITDKSNNTLENLVGLVNNKNKLLQAFIDGLRYGRARALLRLRKKQACLSSIRITFYSPLGSPSLVSNLNDEVGRQHLG